MFVTFDLQIHAHLKTMVAKLDSCNCTGHDVVLIVFVDTELDKELRAILLDPKIIEAVDRASKNATSELEGFHSSLNRNAPKMEGFSYAGMISR